jgi:hypothetical protein
MKRRRLTLTDLEADTPLRLADAAEIAFPGGGITASSLRKEAARGRLVVEKIAGKDFTTLEAIANMRRLCRVEHSRPASTSVSAKAAPPRGSSSIADDRSAQAHLRAIATQLTRRSPTISAEPTGRTSAKVIPIKSK